jgi:hypothetical protein
VKRCLPTALAALALAAPAGAEARPRPASRGIFTEGGLGASAFIGPHQTDAEVGPSISLRGGYDLFSWFSIGLHVGASSHEATVPPPPEGEWFQIYRAYGDGRLGFRVDELAFFAEGGLGVAYISSNVLGKVGVTEPGENFTFAFNAGGGLEYQIKNRHYAFGLAGDWWLMPELDALTGVDMRLYLRYTY